ncbi:TIGR01777 family oxidoreductase [Psychrobacter sp. HD31]|uniref:TIGR01777 family oxidoreductase n=1 Tax=Psychrobacter sp. HD31 TaxID=3112003 RepID=UPI003DA49042
MHILITGGSGFLGQALTKEACKQDDVTITWVSRNTNTPKSEGISGLNIIDYDELKTCQTHFDVIINLAGAGIADKRWSTARKKVLFDSRLNPTQAILDYIAQAHTKPKLFISGSAIGWYGAQIGDEILTEQSPAQTNDFAHSLCQQWEDLAITANQYNVPVAIIRTGVVISPTGGMITKLKTPFSLGVGGNLGNGKQIMSWISVNDWVRAVLFIIKQNAALNKQSTQLTPKQIYNLTAPTAVNNREFTKAVGSWLNRPTVLHQPAFVVKQLFGEMATLLIDGQNVYPQNLLDMGFKFEHGSVGEALNSE